MLLSFQGRSIDLSGQPFHMLVILSFFAGFVFITALSITAVMRMLEKRILDLAELTEAVTALNDKLNTLYTMTQAIRIQTASRAGAPGCHLRTGPGHGCPGHLCQTPE